MTSSKETSFSGCVETDNAASSNYDAPVADPARTRPAEHILRALREDPHRRPYGGCPLCGRATRFIVLWGENWFVCRDHRTRWCIGNMFESLPWELRAERAIARYLSSFREVEPVYDPDDDEDQAPPAGGVQP